MAALDDKLLHDKWLAANKQRTIDLNKQQADAALLTLNQNKDTLTKENNTQQGNISAGGVLNAESTRILDQFNGTATGSGVQHQNANILGTNQRLANLDTSYNQGLQGIETQKAGVNTAYNNNVLNADNDYNIAKADYAFQQAETARVAANNKANTPVVAPKPAPTTSLTLTQIVNSIKAGATTSKPLFLADGKTRATGQYGPLSDDVLDKNKYATDLDNYLNSINASATDRKDAYQLAGIGTPAARQVQQTVEAQQKPLNDLINTNYNTIMANRESQLIKTNTKWTNPKLSAQNGASAEMTSQLINSFNGLVGVSQADKNKYVSQILDKTSFLPDSYKKQVLAAVYK